MAAPYRAARRSVQRERWSAALRAAFRGREEHGERELLGDRVESMLGPGRHEHDRAGLDRAILAADANPRPAPQHEIDLVLRVRALRIAAARGQHVEADGERRPSQELLVERTV